MNCSKKSHLYMDKYKDMILFFVIVLSLGVLLFWKCQYGFGNIDESFYLTIPYRFCQGDRLFLNEWHISLMSGYILEPLMRIYLHFTDGSTDGMILPFRYIYVFFQLLAACVIYLMLRQYSKPGAMIGCTVWAIYAPFCISALSYNSMGIIFLTTALAIFAGSDRRVLSVVSGVLYANSVLCCPYLAILWASGFIVFLYYIFSKKEDSLPAKFICSTIGIAVTALLFLFHVFSQITLSDLLAVLPNILSDPEHSTDIVNKLHTYYTSLIYDNPAGLIIFSLYFILFIASVFARSNITKQCCFVFLLTLTVAHLFTYIKYDNYLNPLLFPINLTGLISFLLYRNKKSSILFCRVWIPGMIYTVCLHFSSNQDFYAISSASAVSVVASIILVFLTAQDILKNCSGLKKIIISISMLALILVQGGSELYYRINSIFWDTSISTQNTLLSEGPESGLYVSEDKQQVYQSYISDLRNLQEAEMLSGNVLFFSDQTWLYLCGAWRNASFSAWLSGADDKSIAKLETYYKINPDKAPDYIFIDGNHKEYLDIFTQKWGYNAVCVTDNHNILLEKTIF